VTPEEFAAAAGVSRETLEKFKQYQRLLEKWQAKINLVGPATLGDVWRRHFDDSSQIFPIIINILQNHVSRFATPESSQNIDSTNKLDKLETAENPPYRASLVDLGSGAGFPGLVVALLAADRKLPLNVHLVESDQRKAAFLIEVARATNVAESLRVHATRAESLSRAGKIKADIVTARALAPLGELLELATPFLAEHGECVFLKGASVADELTAASRTWKIRVDRIESRSGAGGVVLRVREFSRA
jgi:16S rRNA (guanine527-N7)-methyltransferase